MFCMQCNEREKDKDGTFKIMHIIYYGLLKDNWIVVVVVSVDVVVVVEKFGNKVSFRAFLI